MGGTSRYLHWLWDTYSIGLVVNQGLPKLIDEIHYLCVGIHVIVFSKASYIFLCRLVAMTSTISDIC